MSVKTCCHTLIALSGLLLCKPLACFALFVDESATFEYASHAALVRWPVAMDTLDQTPSSVRLVGRIPIKDEDRERPLVVPLSEVDWQHSVLVLLLKSAPPGKVSLFSKEAAALKGPTLIVQGALGPRYVSPSVDTFVSPTTRRPQGTLEYLRISTSQITVLTFNLPTSNQAGAWHQAELLLHLTDKQFGDSVLEVFQLPPQTAAESLAQTGLAARYPNDVNIQSAPEVYHAENFDQQDMLTSLKRWSGLSSSRWRNVSAYTPVPHSAVHHFTHMPGYVAEAHFRTNKHLALNMDYYFAENTGTEPDEVYLRYYLMLEAGAQFAEGGKLPGFGGTYGRAGWGGRANDGFNGWSARGTFFTTLPSYHPYWPGGMPIGSYFYEAGQENQYGDRVAWGQPRSVLVPGQWHCIEQRIRLNTPGLTDGLFQAWVDGILVFTRENLNFRLSEALKIEKIWMNFYYGGAELPKRDFRMYLDNIVIASDYIGPLQKGP